MEQTRFAILGVQRTGTTLLMGLLDQHPDVVCVGEIFQYRTENVQYGIRRFRAYVHDSPQRRILDLIRWRGIVYDYLDTVFPPFEQSATGFKIMLDQIRRYRPVLDYLRQNQYKIIHVVRSNVLKTHVSRLRARRSGVYHSSQPTTGSKIRIPVVSLLQELALLSEDNAELASLVSELGLANHTTTYESLRGEKWPAEQQKILHFLGVNPDVALRPKSVKLTADDLEQVIENYDEVVRVLENTPYESCLSG